MNNAGSENNIFSKVIICVPTCNRCNIINDILSYSSDYYNELGINVMYYDSSDNEDTSRLIDEYVCKGFSNLRYVKATNSKSIDQKLYNLFKSCEYIRGYDYLWLINDSIAIEKEFLCSLKDKLEDKIDIIRLAAPGYGHKEDLYFDNPNEWFNECSAGMAHMASTIISTKLLEDADWDYLYKKYICNDIVGDETHQYFFTVGFYLEQICKLKSFRGLLVGNKLQWRHDSELKRGVSYWNDYVFEVWARSYCDTILAIPDCYTNKEEVIKKSDNIIFGRFQKRGLEAFRKSGLLNDVVVRKYEKYWKLVSTLSLEQITEISEIAPESIVIQNGNWEDNLENIMKEYTGGNIVIYGAGMQSVYVIEKLSKMGLKKYIYGIAVSKIEDNVDEIAGISVKSIQTYQDIKGETMVIIATKPDAADSIQESLKNKGFRKIYRVL